MSRMSKTLLPINDRGNERMKDSHTSTQALKKSQSGYSFVELLVVVLIILLIATMAVPAILSSLARANEASAAASIRVILEAQNIYRNMYGNYTDLASMGREYVDDQSLRDGKKSGYYFYCDGSGISFTATAVPVLWNGNAATGRHSYYADQTNVIRFCASDGGAEADLNSPPLH